MEKTIKEIVLKYIDELKDSNHRFLSWEHCYNAFRNFDNTDHLALHLAFYLASWGMYRGSTTLHKKDYKVHYGVVQLIKPIIKEHKSIKNLEEIQDLMTEISLKYKEVGIKASKTLQTKVLLGTLSCFPALDRFFIDGWNEVCKSQLTDEKILDFAIEKANDIKNCQETINRSIAYPPMKIIDMYFWQIGYIINEDKKKKEKEEKMKKAQKDNIK